MGRTKIREKMVVDADFLSEQEFQDAKGVPNGVAPLDENGKIPCQYIDESCITSSEGGTVTADIINCGSADNCCNDIIFGGFASE